MLEENKLYALVHTGGTQAGTRWPAVYVGVEEVTNLDEDYNGTYHNFVYLQTTALDDNRLARASVRDGNFTQTNGDITITDCHKVMYSTAEGHHGKLLLESHKSLLAKLVPLKILIVDAEVAA